MQQTSSYSRDVTPRWHALPGVEVLAAVESEHDGLTVDEADARLARFGRNALPTAESRSLLAVFWGQFKSPLIYLLLAAGAIAFSLGHVSDAVVILIVVVTNALIGSFQEGRAERSLQALRRLATQKARVIRDGREHVIDASDVVPGDLIVLEAGDAVPADARVLDGAALQLAEAALTGESVPVAKQVLPVDADAPLADRRDMVYAGTHVTAGRARAVVVATGTATEIGHIAVLAGTAKEPRTPLEQRVAQFGRYVFVAAAVTFTTVLAIGWLRGMELDQMLMIAISQVVGMVPEGLPVAMTIALAVGVQRMARRRAVVRRLSAVETLGSTTVICSDKTGTLTRNEMTVTAVVLPDGTELTVSGAGYAPDGELRDARGDRHRIDGDVRTLIEAATLCNDAQLHAPAAPDVRWTPIGDPTEVALVALALKAGLVPDEIRAQFPRRAEIPFDSAAKMMATQHASPAGPFVIVKGAPEVVLDLCSHTREGGRDIPLTEPQRRAMHECADTLASRALRVLAFAVVERTELAEDRPFERLAGHATLLGFLGQIDPPRVEVEDAVARCRAAGIRPVMVTGDHRATAHAIARQLGIAQPDDLVVDGRELDQMSDAELAERIENIAVFARVHPDQKLRIVDAYQQRGEVVAMTGDGVNDAPALVKADVGVAMGITGTEVAKESARIVISDDNFATIVAAVEEGRVVYRNIKKSVLLLFATSAAEVAVLLLALLLGYPPPLAAVQILWINLVTEGLITVNLIMEPAEGDEMRSPPISTTEPLLTRTLLTRMAVMAPTMVAVTLGWFIARTAADVPEAQVRTETLTLLAICVWFNVLNCRSESRSALTLSIFKNAWLVGGLVLGNLLQIAVVFWEPLGRVFHTVPFGAHVALALAGVGSLVLWTEELRKLLVRRRERRVQQGM